MGRPDHPGAVPLRQEALGAAGARGAVSQPGEGPEGRGPGREGPAPQGQGPDQGQGQGASRPPSRGRCQDDRRPRWRSNSRRSSARCRTCPRIWPRITIATFMGWRSRERSLRGFVRFLRHPEPPRRGTCQGRGVLRSLRRADGHHLLGPDRGGRRTGALRESRGLPAPSRQAVCKSREPSDPGERRALRERSHALRRTAG